MATKYRRNDSPTNNNWSTDNNWSTTSVTGTANTTAPTSADDVIFGSASQNTTLSAAGACLSIDFTNGGTSNFGGTFTHGAFNLEVYGNFKASSTMTYTVTNGLVSNTTFKATTTGWTITSNGKTLTQFTFDGVGGEWTFQDAMTLNFALTLTNGSLKTNGKTVSTQYFIATSANTKSITFGATNMTVTGTDLFGFGQGAFYLNPTGTTISATSLTLTCNGAISTSVTQNFAGAWIGVLTISNINAFMTGLGGCLIGTLVMSGASTSATGGAFLFDGDVVAFNFSPTGVGVTGRLWLRSSVRGTQRTITVDTTYGHSAYGTSNYLDFQDIVPAGTPSVPTGGTAGIWGTGTGSNTSYGDAGNNGANISFTTPVTRWMAAGGNWQDATCWSATNSPRTAGASAPLCHDTAILDATSGSGTLTMQARILLPATVTCTGFTGTISFNNAIKFFMFGSLTLGSGMTISAGTNRYLYFHNTGTVTSNGKTFPMTIAVEAPSDTVTFADAFVCTGTFYHIMGTVTMTSASVSFPAYASAYSYTRALNLGSNTVSVTGSGTVWDYSVTTGLSVSCGTSIIDFTDATATTKTISFGGQTFYTIRMSGTGTGTYYFYGGFAGGFGNFTCTNFISTKTNAFTIQFAWLGSFTIGSWQVSGSSGNVVTITSDAGVQHFIAVSGPSAYAAYLNISWSAIGPAGNVTNGTNSGNNTNWFFTATTSRQLGTLGVGK